MPSWSKRESSHMPSFWSLRPMLKACAPDGTAREAASSSVSASRRRRLREAESTGKGDIQAAGSFGQGDGDTEVIGSGVAKEKYTSTRTSVTGRSFRAA